MLLSPASMQAGKDLNPQHHLFYIINFFLHQLPLLCPHCLCLSTSLGQGPHLLTVPKVPVSVSSLPSTFTEGHKQPEPDRPKQTFSMVRDPGGTLLTLTCLLLGLCCTLPPTFHDKHFPLHFPFPTVNLSIIRFQVKTAGILYSLSSTMWSFCQLLKRDCRC